MVEPPSVSVVVLNWNGRRFLDDCFASLHRLDYPREQLELMLVDNGSSDDSLAFMRTRYPEVRLVPNGANLGFSGGNNQGAAAATGRWLVFLNNDTRADPALVRELVGAIGTRPAAVCAGARILSWNGEVTDFGGGAANFAGFGYQPGFGDPADRNDPGPVTSTLFACGGAMLIDRHVFLDVGGFDDDYFIYFEDVDLGWRLWLLGHEVVFAPRAVVYHHLHGTMRAAPDHRKRVLYTRNAMYTVLKNYEDQHLPRVLAAVLLGTTHGLVRSSLEQGRLRLDDYTFPGRAVGPPRAALDPADLSSLVALHEVVEKLPGVMDKRRAIQARRVRSDAEIAELFRWPFRHWVGVDGRTLYAVTDAFDIQAVFRAVRRRVLVVASDILPGAGLPTVGAGLRAWTLGQGLASAGHEVLYSMPRAALVDREGATLPSVAALAWDPHPGAIAALLRKTQPDVVLVCNWAVLAFWPESGFGIPIILDQHGPHLLERRFQGHGTEERNAVEKRAQLAKADFFLCPGRRQAVYFDGWLGQAGWSERERRDRATVVPVSLSPDLPDHRPADQLTFVYGGIFLPWQDPSRVLELLVELMDTRSSGSLRIYGAKHPVHDVDPGIFPALLARLGQSPRVSYHGLLPHAALVAEYARAHVAIDVMRRNAERELAFTTRTVEYLWCGLPVVHHDYGELAPLIREFDAGWVVDPEDSAAIRHALAEIFDRPDLVVARSANARRLVRERFTWDRTVGPLDAFVRNPSLRPHPVPGIGRRLNVKQLVVAAGAVYRQQGATALGRTSGRYLVRAVRRALGRRR